MANDAIERAALGIAEVSVYFDDEWRDMARAALAAALDPEDEAMVRAISIEAARLNGAILTRGEIRAVIAALRAHVGGGDGDV